MESITHDSNKTTSGIQSTILGMLETEKKQTPNYLDINEKTTKTLSGSLSCTDF